MARRNNKLVDVTLLADTTAYAAGDLLIATQVIPNAVRDIDTPMLLQNLTLIDENDQGVAMDIYFLDANASFGTFNLAAAPTAVAARSVQGKVAVATGDWKDLGVVRVATFNNLNIPIKPAAGTKDVYVAIVNGAGTPTFTASGLKMRLGVSE